MAEIPQPFANIHSYADALTAVNAMRTTYQTVSRFPSFLQQFPNTYNLYIDNINQIRDSSVAEKSAVSADMIKQTLSDACPAAAQFYCLSGGFVASSYVFFQNYEYSD
jgi:hypothetical protein